MNCIVTYYIVHNCISSFNSSLTIFALFLGKSFQLTFNCMFYCIFISLLLQLEKAVKKLWFRNTLQGCVSSFAKKFPPHAFASECKSENNLLPGGFLWGGMFLKEGCVQLHKSEIRRGLCTTWWHKGFHLAGDKSNLIEWYLPNWQLEGLSEPDHEDMTYL